MRALRMQIDRSGRRANDRRIVHWSLFCLLLLMAALAMAGIARFDPNAMADDLGAEVSALITGFAFLVAGMRGQVRR